MSRFQHNRIKPAQVVILGFLIQILVGACLLTLPVSTQSGEGASFLDALFTATSATCVTGLVVQDTAQFWSPFGQGVILLLIQIGGMGVVLLKSNGGVQRFAQLERKSSKRVQTQKRA